MEATNTIRDSLTQQIEPVYGLTTMHAALLAFQAEPAPASAAAPVETKSATYAYGLIALGKFILRLPTEILEEELPRMKATLITVRCPHPSCDVSLSGGSLIFFSYFACPALACA